MYCDQAWTTPNIHHRIVLGKTPEILKNGQRGSLAVGFKLEKPFSLLAEL
jgi:hypothetical protein